MYRNKFILACILVLAASQTVFAQSKKSREDVNTRTVQGTVSDEQGNNVDGAIVQLKNMKTLQIRSFITKDQGSYYFHGLSTDIDYELKAQHQGGASKAKTLSSFDNRKQAVINLKIEK